MLKDDAVKVTHSICQQTWKTQQLPQDGKRSLFIPIPKKGNAKECSNYCTIALISHASMEKEMATNSGILAWKNGQRSLVGYSPWVLKESDTTEKLSTHMLANLENSAVTTGLEKVSFHSNAKECSNYCTIAFISHASKVILKILQARPQQCMNCELSDVQAGFRKGRGIRDQINNIHWRSSRKQKRVPEKHLLLLYWLCQSLWLYGSQ